MILNTEEKERELYFLVKFLVDTVCTKNSEDTEKYEREHLEWLQDMLVDNIVYLYLKNNNE